MKAPVKLMQKGRRSVSLVHWDIVLAVDSPIESSEHVDAVEVFDFGFHLPDHRPSPSTFKIASTTEVAWWLLLLGRQMHLIWCWFGNVPNSKENLDC